MTLPSWVRRPGGMYFELPPCNLKDSFVHGFNNWLYYTKKGIEQGKETQQNKEEQEAQTREKWKEGDKKRRKGKGI